MSRSDRHRQLGLALALSLLAALPVLAQAPGSGTLVRAGRLIDGESDRVRTDQGILIEGDRMTRVGPFQEVAAAGGDARVLDLSNMTVLPG